MVTAPVMQTQLRHARRPNVLAIVLLAALIFVPISPLGSCPRAARRSWWSSVRPTPAALPRTWAPPPFAGSRGFPRLSLRQRACPGPYFPPHTFEPAGRITSSVEIPAGRVRPALGCFALISRADPLLSPDWYSPSGARVIEALHARPSIRSDSEGEPHVDRVAGDREDRFAIRRFAGRLRGDVFAPGCSFAARSALRRGRRRCTRRRSRLTAHSHRSSAGCA